MQFFSERRLSMLNRAVASGRILPYLGFFTLVITLISGTVVWILTPSGFDTFGDALWWAAQTVTTVGYGDVVPTSGAGRVVAFVVMVFGVGALSLLTAVVTAAFVSYQQRRLGGDAERQRELLEALARIEHRLDALERPRS